MAMMGWRTICIAPAIVERHLPFCGASYLNPSSPLIWSLVSPPTRGSGRPLSVTAMATIISLAIKMAAHKSGVFMTERDVERNAQSTALF